jgi:NADH-quinone oxidoreductase subunit L
VPIQAPALLPIIVLLPLLGGLINGLFGKWLSRQTVYAISNMAVLASFLISCTVFWQLSHGGPEDGFRYELYRWIAAGNYTFDIAFLADRLSAILLLVVTGVGFLVHLYSTGYMDHEPGYARYFAYLNLFIFSMLMLVLGKNLAMLFIGWEGVGACSYLLIGFWYKDMEKAEAGQEAFVVNRIGDIGFALAIFLLLAYCRDDQGNSSVDYDHLRAALAQGKSALGNDFNVTAICLLLFVGATGKSAQIPLYVWLPDAMAGPTPVSALIHAATMVTAGVYMIARLNFLFALSPVAMTVVMMVGAITAVVAASIGLVQNDIKKVLAYSTVSQLGYMFIGVGAGAFAAGAFHLFTHAFFKACLFLGAGAVIHGLHHEQDIRKMGGLKAKMPVVRWTFLLSCVAIAGLPPLAGFFSKDAILAETVALEPNAELLGKYYQPAIEKQAAAQASGEAAIKAKEAELHKALTERIHKTLPWRKVAFALGLFGALMTAFYMFRLYFLTFEGEYRGDHHTWEHAHDAPWMMAVPLGLLGLLAVVSGWVGMPFAHGKWNVWDHWLHPVLARGHELVEGHLTPTVEYSLMGLSVAVAAAGVATAYTFYKDGPSAQAARIAEGVPGLYRALMDKYRVDEFYHLVVVRPLRGIATGLFHVVDRVLVDLLAVQGPGYTLLGISNLGRLLQNGDVQTYVGGIVLGVAALAWYLI